MLLVKPIFLRLFSIDSYGGGQDSGGKALLSQVNQQLELSGNTWKKFDLGGYEVTKNTVLEFDFQSTREAEISGIGFDNDDSIDQSDTFQISGTQDWGIDAFDNYVINSGWKTYSINAGDYFSGDFQYLTFIRLRVGRHQQANLLH